MKFSFGALVNDHIRLDMCLRRSELDPDIPVRCHYNPISAVDGYNKILDVIEQDGSDVAVLVHQDMYFRNGWLAQVEGQLALLPESWIVAGIVGKCMEGKICGKFHDMRIPLIFNTEGHHTFPQPASCFDECVILVNMKKKFRFDTGLTGFDLYGTMAACQAWEMGGTAWIIDAYAEHYCMRPFNWFPDKNFEAMFKWLHERFPNAPRIDTTVLGVPEKPGPARYDKTAEALHDLIEAAEEEAKTHAENVGS